MNGTTTQALTTQTGSKLIDDFLRRELRVGDPRNPAEVANALRERYRTEAARIDQEGAGLPLRFDDPAALPVSMPAAETPTTRERQRIAENLERDLARLVESPANREWAPELTGWRDKLRREFADSSAVTAQARDVAKRERGFLGVRRLGEYARIARLIGCYSPGPDRMYDYRRLATTLDDGASAIRVMMGEALYRAGLSDGGLIIQFPLTDVRQRRESLMLALRRLAGVVDSETDWGDATASYSALLDAVMAESAPELRVYLREEVMAETLDDLISSISREDSDSLRRLAATSPVEVSRLTRLLRFASAATLPQSPALSNFVQNLKLFLEAFGLSNQFGVRTRSGARLIDLALPLPLAALQVDEFDAAARQTLRALINWRAAFAQEIECAARCACDTADMKVIVALDDALYEIDRAIDLYAQGDLLGEEEARAAVYGLFAYLLLPAPGAFPAITKLRDDLVALHLEQALPNDPAKLFDDVFLEVGALSLEWYNLATSLAPRCADTI